MNRPAFWILIILVIANFALLYLISNHDTPQYDNEADFLVGRWILQNQYSDKFIVYELEFVDSDTLISHIRNNSSNQYNIKFDYSLIDGNRLKIVAPRIPSSEWDVVRDGDTLFINSAIWPKGNGVFQRAVTVNWSFVTFLLSACIPVVLFVIPLKPKSQKTSKDMHLSEGTRSNFSKFSGRMFKNVVPLIVFAIGMAVGVFLWSWPPLLRVRLPWDAVITFEAGIILLILGIRTIMANNKVPAEEETASWHSFSSYFVNGIGIFGVIKGVIKVVMFFMIGYYL